VNNDPPADEQPANEPAKKVLNKDTVKQFVLRITQPFELETEGLGTIVARSMTVGASATFMKRMKSFDGVSNAALVRAYMGSVSGVPVEDKEALPPPLTAEQVALLTDEDVGVFAQGYLEKIVKKPANGDAIAEMAAFIRREREEEVEAAKKWGETMRSAFNVGATADIMKNWGGLTENIIGPVDRLRDEIDRMLGPLGSARSSIGDALRGLEADRDLAAQAAKALDPLSAMGPSIGDALRQMKADGAEEAMKALKNFDQQWSRPDPPDFGRAHERELPLLLPPPIHETPIGRTAVAVEHLHDIGQRMESAMTVVVEQAGNVSGQMGQVLEKIGEEAEKGQRATKWAQIIAVGSLIVSALAFAASAYFSQVGYDADRQDTIAGNEATATMTRELEEQNALLRELLDQYKKGSSTEGAQPHALPSSDKGPVSMAPATDAEATEESGESGRQR
jgi:hypothetical protein